MPSHRRGWLLRNNLRRNLIHCNYKEGTLRDKYTDMPSSLRNDDRLFINDRIRFPHLAGRMMRTWRQYRISWYQVAFDGTFYNEHILSLFVGKKADQPS